MEEIKLSVPERAILLILMAENTELSNSEIGERYADSLKLTGKSREKLVDKKLLEQRKVGQTYAFTLADEGWAWCRKELTAAPPPGSGNPARALFAVLGGIERYLARTNRSLANVFGNQQEAQALAPAPAPDEMEREIRRTYRALAEPAGSWVSLADIRDKLGDWPRRAVDGVLRLMSRLPDVRIEEETNQKSLTPHQRAGAVRIGDREQHVMAIGMS